MKLTTLIALLLALSGCADLSMYNQVPAPVGRTGEASPYPSQPLPQTAQTYPIDEQPIQEDMGQSYDQPIDEAKTTQNPAVVALLDSAYQQSESGQPDMAASKLERAVRISPRDPQVWHALAKVRYQQKKYTLAISLAEKSNLLSAGQTSLQRSNWLLMADCYDTLGRTEDARKARVAANRLF